MKITVYTEGRAEELKKQEASQRITASSIRVLGELAPAIAKNQQADMPPAAAPAAPIEPRPEDADEASRIELQQGELYRQKCKLANELVDMADAAPQDVRKALIDQILAIKERYNRNAVVLQYYQKHGALPRDPEPDKPKLSEMDKLELFQRQRNTRANISKAKKQVEKYQHNPAKVVTYQNKLASLMAELEEIDARIIQG